MRTGNALNDTVSPRSSALGRSTDLQHFLQSRQGLASVWLVHFHRFEISIILKTIGQVIQCRTIHVGTHRADLSRQFKDLLVGILISHTIDQIDFGPDGYRGTGRRLIAILNDVLG